MKLVEPDEAKVWGFAGPIPGVKQLTRVLTTIAWTVSWAWVGGGTTCWWLPCSPAAGQACMRQGSRAFIGGRAGRYRSKRLGPPSCPCHHAGLGPPRLCQLWPVRLCQPATQRQLHGAAPHPPPARQADRRRPGGLPGGGGPGDRQRLGGSPRATRCRVFCSCLPQAQEHARTDGRAGRGGRPASRGCCPAWAVLQTCRLSGRGATRPQALPRLQKLVGSKGAAQEAEILTYVADPIHMVGRHGGAHAGQWLC